MPPEFVPGPLSPGVGAMPTLFICKTTSGFGPQIFTATNFGSGWVAVVCGVDITASGSPSGGPMFCFMEADGPGTVGRFYYDSQSIGEGLGIDFAWRGMIKLEKGWTLKCTMDPNGITTSASCVAWGFVMQQPAVTFL